MNNISKEETKKSNNEHKVSNIILSFLVIFLFVVNISLVISYHNQGIKVSYNGLSYSDDQAYINIYVENKSPSQVLIAYNNFAIKSENTNAITPDTMYYLDIDSRMHQDLEYFLSGGKGIRLKLNYDSYKIPNKGALYYNGEKIADL